MSKDRTKEESWCSEFQRLYDTKLMFIEELGHHSTGTGTKSSTLYLVKIDSSLGKSPCDYQMTLPPCPPHSSCRLVVKGVKEDQKTYDYYLMNCHYGPPCAFMEGLR